MSGDDQERFEDYLELERYIEDLQAGRVAHPPSNLTPAQARLYQMANLFRSASSTESEAQPEFVDELRSRLLSPDIEHRQETLDEVIIAPVPSPKSHSSQTSHNAKFVSRRSLLTGGAVAAASLAVGIGTGTLIEQSSQPVNPPNNYTASHIVGENVPTVWHFVTTLAQLGNNTVKFVTDSVIGYVMLRDSDDTNDRAAGTVVALSAACTHMGCIIRWDDQDQQFHCPCHGGMFDKYGKPATSGTTRYLRPLPYLKTMIKDGNVYVQIPKPR